MLRSRMHGTGVSNSLLYQRAIAPAPGTEREQTAPYTKPKHSPTSIYANGTTLDSNNPAVVRRNARERNRVKQVNNGFSNLRQHLPMAIIADLSNGRRGIGPGADKKLSKVDTLRMAVEYIRRLQRVVREVDDKCDGSSSSSNSSIVSDTFSVNSLMSGCESSSSSTSSPPPPLSLSSSGNGGCDFKTEVFCPISYAGSFPINALHNVQYEHNQQDEHQQQLISPAGSIGSTCSSTTSSYRSMDSTTFQPYENHSTFIGNNHSHHHKSVSMIQEDHHMKFEQCYDDYQQSASASDDEEILHYISLWQDEL